MLIGGHDPTGGAGIQADIETAIAHRCCAHSLVTCLTAQDTSNVQQVYPQNPQNFSQQANRLINDIAPDWIKMGLIGDVAIGQQITRILFRLNKPIVLDPVLAAGGGSKLAGQQLIELIYEHLLPHVYLLTPNRAEARLLSGEKEIDAAIAKLLSQGCQYILLTGADEAQGNQVVNTLYSAQNKPQHFIWPELPNVYHGSGCTLATACTCQLAKGLNILDAVQAAQAFTWQSLSQAQRTGKGQLLPCRWLNSMPKVDLTD